MGLVGFREPATYTRGDLGLSAGHVFPLNPKSETLRPRMAPKSVGLRVYIGFRV